MAIEKVREYFKKYGIEDKIQEFDVSSATVELAAKALHCEPKRIAKTLSFIVNDSVILIVVAGDAKIDNKKYKQKFSTKAKMIPVEEVVELVGHGVGGVCPFAINEGINVYLDESLRGSIQCFLLVEVVIVQLNLLFLKLRNIQIMIHGLMSAKNGMRFKLILFL